MKIKDNKIDSLFRERLDGFEIEPSAGAQEMLDRFISGKHQKIISIRIAIAAAIVLVVTSGILLSGYLNKFRNYNLAGSVSLNKNDVVQNPEDTAIKIPEKPQAHSLAIQPVSVNRVNNNSRLNKVNPLKNTAVNTANDGITTPARPEVKLLDNKFLAVSQNKKLNNSIPSINKSELTNPETKRTPVVIEYFGDDQASKPGKEKSQLVEGIVSKAKEIGREVNYGEIRDLKNQLFALDFIKSKREDNYSK